MIFRQKIRIPQIAFLYALLSLLCLHPVLSPAEPRQNSRASDNIWEIVAKNSTLKVDLSNPRIQEQIEFYRKRPHTLNSITDQAEPYLHLILEEIEARNLPHELILLPIMESAYDPTIRSGAGASGLWQFMPRTAKHFGLTLDWWYDGRNDVHSSTHKALEYMTYLVKLFDGDWHLAAAAYDSGEGTVKRAIKKNKAAGKKADYWSLDLPKETQKYVPRLLALAHIFSHPKEFGLSLNHVENRPYLQKVNLGRQMSLVKVAELAKLNVETLMDLNPGYKRLVTSPQGPHEVMVPITNASTLENNLAKLTKDEHRSWFKYHVAHGDSLKDLASRHDTSESMIKKINRLSHSINLEAGMQLALPKPLTQKVIPTKALGQQKMAYTINQNDSLWTISKKFQVKLSDLKKWNPQLKDDTLMMGDTLNLWISTPQTSSSANNELATLESNIYTVVSGDSLSVIARRFHTSVDAIKTANNLSSNSLQIGQTLMMPS